MAGPGFFQQQVGVPQPVDPRTAAWLAEAIARTQALGVRQPAGVLEAPASPGVPAPAPELPMPPDPGARATALADLVPTLPLPPAGKPTRAAPAPAAAPQQPKVNPALLAFAAQVGDMLPGARPDQAAAAAPPTRPAPPPVRPAEAAAPPSSIAAPRVAGWLPDVVRNPDGSLPTGDALIDAVIQAESNGDPNAVNPRSGASGLMQIMEATARQPGYGVKPMRWEDRFDPAENRRFGTDYLNAMLDTFGGDTELALMAYNWGAGNVKRWLRRGADPDKIPAETRQYVARILPTLRQELHGSEGRDTVVGGGTDALDPAAADAAEPMASPRMLTEGDPVPDPAPQLPIGAAPPPSDGASQLPRPGLTLREAMQAATGLDGYGRGPMDKNYGQGSPEQVAADVRRRSRESSGEWPVGAVGGPDVPLAGSTLSAVERARSRAGTPSVPGRLTPPPGRAVPPSMSLAEAAGAGPARPGDARFGEGERAPISASELQAARSRDPLPPGAPADVPSASERAMAQRDAGAPTRQEITSAAQAAAEATSATPEEREQKSRLWEMLMLFGLATLGAAGGGAGDLQALGAGGLAVMKARQDERSLDAAQQEKLAERRARAPETQTFYDDSGAPYVAQWDPGSQSWVRVGRGKPERAAEPYSDLGKLRQDLDAGRITQAEYDAERQRLADKGKSGGDGPQTSIGKARADLQAGRITQAEFDAIVTKEQRTDPLTQSVIEDRKARREEAEARRQDAIDNAASDYIATRMKDAALSGDPQVVQQQVMDEARRLFPNATIFKSEAAAPSPAGVAAALSAGPPPGAQPWIDGNGRPAWKMPDGTIKPK
jgi:soluble lytic murein transglycosylase-like protein